MPGKAKRTAARILLVDDEPDTVAGIRTRLLARGYDVFSAQTGAEGLAAARREQPDLIILDLKLPEGDGSTVAHQLAQDARTNKIPVVFLTCLADALDVEQTGKTADGRWLLPKTLDAKTLLAVIEDAMGRTSRGGAGGSRRAASPG